MKRKNVFLVILSVFAFFFITNFQKFSDSYNHNDSRTITTYGIEWDNPDDN